MGYWKARKVVERWHGVECSNKCLGPSMRVNCWDDWARGMVGAKCKCGGTFVEYSEDVEVTINEYQPGDEP